MTVEELVASIARWVGANSETDQAPRPRWSVDAAGLLDHIAAETGIDSLWLDDGKRIRYSRSRERRDG